VIVLSIAGAFGVVWLVYHEPRPEGRPEGADALARRMEEAANVEAWARTGAVQWNMAGRHEHLWDRERDVSRMRWGDNEVLLRIGGPYGRAYEDGVELEGDDARDALEYAWKYWCNDSFWLNPIEKLRDDGVTLSVVGDDSLLVSYASGGVTPGDSYQWFLDDDGLPTAWRMWVSVIPVGGAEATWERWETLSTGARVSTLHRLPLGIELSITDVEGAATLAELVPGEDPFAPLFEESR
jgi:hypothetical protein